MTWATRWPASRPRLLWLLLVLGLAFGWRPSAAHAQLYRLASFATTPNAPGGFVYATLQDHTGLLWIGTGDGLYCYDGTVFRRFTRANGLAEDFVTAIFEDQQQRLWVGHYQGGLSLMPEPGNTFRRVGTPSATAGQIVGMTQNPEGIWVATQRGGLLFIPDVAPDRPQAFALPPGEQRPVRAIADVRGHLFVAYAGGGVTALAVESLGKPLRAKGGQVFYNDEATVLVADTTGNALVVGTGKGHCSRFRVTQGGGLGSEQVLLAPGLVNHLRKGLTSGQLSSRARTLWLTSQSGALIGVPLLLNSRFTPVPLVYRLNQQLGPYPLTTVLEDQEGALWLGTAGDGLRCLTDRQATLFDAPSTGLPAASVTALARLPGGNLLVGTPQGLWRATPDGFGGLRARAVPGPLAQIPIRRLLRTPDGQTWAGTTKGLWRARSDTTAFQPVALPGLGVVTALAIDHTQRLWIGTESQGAWWLTPEAAPIQHYTTANGLLHNAIYDLLCDKQGNTWFATHGTGLAMREPGGRIKVAQLTTGGVDINALAQTIDGDVWVATNGDGLFRFRNAAFEKVYRVDSTQGLVSDYAYALLASPNGSLFIGHQNGLTLYRLDTDAFRPLSRPDDPRSPELQRLFNAGAVAQDPNGLLRWFGTGQGLLRLERPPARAGGYVPPAVITDLQLDDRHVAPSQLRALDPGVYKVRFSYRGITLAEAGKLQYRYHLKGFAPDWTPPTQTTEAVFSRLEEGTYVFEVQARLGNTGQWSLPTPFTFSVATPFQRTWWFRVACVVGAIALGWGYVRWMFRQARRTQATLEKAVADRTHELQQEKQVAEQERERIRQMNVELTKAKEAADASRLAKAQFLANMSHEIRTPMNAVVGMTHLLAQTRPTAEQRDYVHAISASARNLMVIINDILDSSKIEANKLTLERVPFHLTDLLRQVQQLFRQQAVEKKLDFRVEVAPDVPEVVLGDAVRLNQVLINLINNAIKFTSGGAVTVLVTRAPGTAGRAVGTTCLVQFAVHDTGIGIPADKLDTIFEEFAQANTSTTRQFGGTGLGLSIARHLVRLHGGELLVESLEGQGSTFSFCLPYEIAPTEAAPRTSDEPVTVAPFAPALAVLVVEDNEMNQFVARCTLEHWHCQVTVAANGRLALETVANAATPFAAILMDVQMPEMDGYEATRRLRQLPRYAGVPIVGLTASVLVEDHRLALEAGMNETLGKPFDPAELYGLLRRLTQAPVAELPAETAAPQPAAAPDSAPPQRPHLPEAPAPAPDTPDLHLLEEMSFGQPAKVAEYIGTFVRDARPLLEALRGAARRADWPTVAQATHKLRGQVAYFGLPDLHRALGTAEEHARHPAAAPALPQEVASLIARVEDVLPLLVAQQHAIGVNS